MQQSQEPCSNCNNLTEQIKPSWRRFTNPEDPESKFPVFRVFGVCEQFPQFNITSVQDPRRPPDPRKIVKFLASDLPVPTFELDDEYCAIPPNREVALVGLNDNIDEKFLLQLCKKITHSSILNLSTNHIPSLNEVEENSSSSTVFSSSIGINPKQIKILRHPSTGRHLGMALIDFLSNKDGKLFILRYHGRPMMGREVQCFFDPFVYKLGELYKLRVGEELELPDRYRQIFNERTILHIRLLLSEKYKKEDESEVKIEKNLENGLSTKEQNLSAKKSNNNASKNVKQKEQRFVIKEELKKTPNSQDIPPQNVLPKNDVNEPSNVTPKVEPQEVFDEHSDKTSVNLNNSTINSTPITTKSLDKQQQPILLPCSTKLLSSPPPSSASLSYLPPIALVTPKKMADNKIVILEHEPQYINENLNCTGQQIETHPPTISSSPQQQQPSLESRLAALLTRRSTTLTNSTKSVDNNEASFALDGEKDKSPKEEVVKVVDKATINLKSPYSENASSSSTSSSAQVTSRSQSQDSNQQNNEINKTLNRPSPSSNYNEHHDDEFCQNGFDKWKTINNNRREKIGVVEKRTELANNVTVPTTIIIVNVIETIRTTTTKIIQIIIITDFITDHLIIIIKDMNHHVEDFLIFQINFMEIIFDIEDLHNLYLIQELMNVILQ
ncbi:Histone-lysine N-methyltransferase [Meloidogyne graminicola]|uniref:Histone-lysine N-methyltransferase n=1 Tax=Meloidogyne graminicola TaxID=189291 RepID=A0A8S9ZNH1_9BILA|nr:Histone-lysine N-methyltransferase [Meloidogyne graminicola]